MKTPKRRILWGVLLALVAICGVFLFMATLPPIRLELVDHYPAKRIQFVNDTGRALNFFFFTEVKSNGTWVTASPQPKGARGANGAKPHSVREFEMVPAPAEETGWRVGLSYQPAGSPWYLEWAKRFDLLRNYRAHFFDFKTVYAEATQ